MSPRPPLRRAGASAAAPRAAAARSKQNKAAFVAIDFETADSGRDSACAIALVRVEEGCIVRRENHLIRPPRQGFEFTHIHGITWDEVAEEPTFRQLWPVLEPVLEGARFLAAHNASFDRSVLDACCRAAGLEPPPLPFECTMKLARQAWGLYPTRLPDVCRHLGVKLRHHDPLSDAEACARIVIAARRAVPVEPASSSPRPSTSDRSGAPRRRT